MTGTRIRALGLAACSVAAGLSCSNAGADLGYDPSGIAAVEVQAYLDRDGSRTRTAADTVYAGAQVSLRPPEGGQVFLTGATDALGVKRFNEVAYGEYSVTVDVSSIGDSLLVAAVDSNRVRVRLGSTPPPVVVRLAYPEVSIRAARTLPAGKRVMLRASVLAGVQSFGDTTAHVMDTSGQLRLTRVSLRAGSVGNNPGDSVSVLGTISARAGQPTLDQALITNIVARPAPVALSVTSAVAAAASGGSLDAGLVLVTGAVISDTATVVPDFRVVGSDGSGPVSVILDGTGNYNRAAFIPGRTMIVRGVLVPDGTGKWQLKPRFPLDITVF